MKVISKWQKKSKQFKLYVISKRYIYIHCIYIYIWSVSDYKYNRQLSVQNWSSQVENQSHCHHYIIYFMKF